MLLVYISITGNVRDFVERTGFDSYEIDSINPYHDVNEDYILIVPSYDEETSSPVTVTQDSIDFINHGNNFNHLIGFASSGNLNFDDLYCVNAKELSRKYEKPLMFTFEYAGTDKDIEDFKKEVGKIAIA